LTLGHVDLLTLPAHRRVGFGIGYMPEDRRLVRNSPWKKTSACRTWDDASGRRRGAAGMDLSPSMPEVARFRTRRALELSGGNRRWWRSRGR